MSQRFEGHNLEDALSTAASALNVDRYRLTHRVLLEKRGFLGGIKRVVIEVDVNPAAEMPAAATPATVAAATATEDIIPPRAAPAPARPPIASRDGGRGRGAGRAEGGGGRRHDGRTRERGRGGPPRDRRPSYNDDLRPGDFERVAAVDVPEQGPQSEAAVAVRDWCESVIDLSQLALTVRTEEDDARIVVRLFGADTKRLVDRHGELLDALQVLANKALVGRRADKDIELDCEAFKERRESDLVERAHATADRVRRDGREQLLPAMSPIERRIVHLALRDDEEVTTESRGDGFYKRVAIVRRPAGEVAEARNSSES